MTKLGTGTARALVASAALLAAGLQADLAAPAADDLTAELLGVERRFYEGWQHKSLKPFEDNIASDGVAWGEYGTFDKAQQLEMQKGAEAGCEVRRYSLTEAAVRKIAADVAILTYRVEQDATCGGGPVPSPLTNTSIYARRGGRWLNVFRAGLPVKTLPAR